MWITTTILLGIIAGQLVRGLHLRALLDEERRAHSHTSAMRRVAEAQLSSSLAVTLRDAFDRNRQRASELDRLTRKTAGRDPN